MNYRNLLERYKSGTATQEEKQLIEAELEKNEAIDDYLSEQLINALPNIGSIESTRDEKAEAKKIRKRIGTKFARTIAASVTLVAALTCVTLFAIFPAINGMYYNPLKGSSDRFKPIGGQLSLDMSVFSELRLSGYEIPFAYTKPEGFGVYDVTLYQYDCFRNFAETPIHAKIVRGEFKPSIWEQPFINGLGLNWVQSAYGLYSDTTEIDIVHQSAMNELPLLPESARVKAYIFFKDGIDMQVLNEIRKEAPVRILWAGIKTDDAEKLWNVRFGFSPTGKRLPLSAWRIYGSNPYNESEYPLLELDPSEPSGGIDTIAETALSPEAYETHFLSMLKFLSTRQEFFDVLRMSADYAQDITQAKEYAEQYGIRCITIVVSGTRDEIMSLTEHPSVEYIALDDVMVSEFMRH